MKKPENPGKSAPGTDRTTFSVLDENRENMPVAHCGHAYSRVREFFVRLSVLLSQLPKMFVSIARIIVDYNATPVGYFRGGKRGKEIGIVADYPNTKINLIEVKYRTQLFFKRKM